MLFAFGKDRQLTEDKSSCSSSFPSSKATLVLVEDMTSDAEKSGSIAGVEWKAMPDMKSIPNSVEGTLSLLKMLSKLYECDDIASLTPLPVFEAEFVVREG